MSRQELLRSLGIGLVAWTAVNAVNAYGNYTASQSLPEPLDWLAIAGPALGAAVAFFLSRSKPTSSANLQKVLDAIATLLSSGVGGELKALADALKAKGFPTQGSLNVTFQDGVTQVVDWSLKPRNTQNTRK